ncbi:hypothetical protein [Oceanobacillus manasiensis]|uniref:hypothetical protein n=1 Tax=Oceanobacillus manasiensis TaxID=586413 RepID=UPI0005AB20F8|nr:hypothetical protein [Oceanobacillus manasiensis]
MKVLRTVKGKIAVGVLTVGVISGTGAALAGTDAGANLKSWYDSLFDKTAAEIEADVTAYGEGKLPGLTAEYNGLKADASGDIDGTRASETEGAEAAITQVKNSHIESLEGKKSEILEGMGLEFYNLFLKGFWEIERLGKEGVDYATNDLTAFTGTEGEEALGQLTNDLTAAKDSAVSELEEAIRQAEEEIAAEVENQKEINTRNLQNRINWKIDDVRDEVEGLLEGLVEEQKAIITAAAQTLEDDAKSALDDVVSSMSNGE